MPNEVDLPALPPDEPLSAPPKRLPGPSKFAPINPVMPLAERPRRFHRGTTIIRRGYTGRCHSGIDVEAVLSDRATLFVHQVCVLFEQRGHQVGADDNGLALIVGAWVFRLRVSQAPTERLVATFQPDKFSMRPAFRCADRQKFRAEEYIADAIAALEVKAVSMSEWQRELDARHAAYVLEEGRRYRRGRRHKFIREMADGLDHLRTLEALLVRLMDAQPASGSGVDRLASELRSMIDEALLGFSADRLEAEIRRLDLFRDDD